MTDIIQDWRPYRPGTQFPDEAVIDIAVLNRGASEHSPAPLIEVHLDINPRSWHVDKVVAYRVRRPATVTINGVECLAPLSCPPSGPETGTKVYKADPCHRDYYTAFAWEPLPSAHLLLSRGLLFSTAYDAAKAGEAMAKPLTCYAEQ